MGVIGTGADNALAGSCNSTVKTEVLRNRKVFANSLLCWREVFSVVHQMQDTAPALLVWTDIV
ncbi:hypothetical protein CIP107507_01862 [Corynebacterium diphtheriae]|nr:hypothetical protein CDCE8392_1906 [Corynebacterium diphtheriae CDCE 8392]CAB0522122.1 hypothetical protein CIP107507_01862 [Corynebacterium diphtheriae]CAB0872470.1 hypothetical protein FRC0376_02082 [Corynebacterium diphtheriae]CAB0918120.1 hypothetical protein FRC0409_02105 [Corynebacterium diphtheriae]CAB1047242.1 hypothetical protein FRC0544_02111 [Corynebacterium diphtheriae]